MHSAIGCVGVGGGLFAGFDEDEDGFFQKCRMVDARTTRYRRPQSFSRCPNIHIGKFSWGRKSTVVHF